MVNVSAALTLSALVSKTPDAKRRPVADVNDDGLRPSAMVRITKVVSSYLGIGEVILCGKA